MLGVGTAGIQCPSPAVFLGVNFYNTLLIMTLLPLRSSLLLRNIDDERLAGCSEWNNNINAVILDIINILLWASVEGACY